MKTLGLLMGLLLVPAISRADVLWYLIGNSTGEKSGRNAQAQQDAELLRKKDQEIQDLRAQLTACAEEKTKKTAKKKSK